MSAAAQVQVRHRRPSATANLPGIRSEAASGRLLPAAFARAATYLTLALFASLHWAPMSEPSEPRRAFWALGIGMAAALALLALRRAPVWVRLPGAALVSVSALGLALLTAGVADEYLRPERWGDLAAGLTRGVDAIPGVRVPYRGLDEWTRVAVLAGGSFLTVGAALLAFWPRRRALGFRIPALIALVTLYATPAVALIFDAEFARGALLTILVLAFLRLERLGLKDAPGALAIGSLTGVLALMAAPALDRDTPWWDYETWALSAASSKSTSFNWQHDYGPLDWPRDGRELLRVKARLGTYWKADSLDLFDGQRWLREPLPTRNFDPQLPDDLDRVQQWSQEIKVTVRNLRSVTFVVAGTTDEVVFPRRQPLISGVSGIYNAPRTLRRGDSYSAHVYTPRAPAKELRSAGTFYEDWLGFYRSIQLPDVSSPVIEDPSTPGIDDGARTRIDFQEFDSGGPPDGRTIRFAGAPPFDATSLLEQGRLRRTWALSQRLKEGARTPYDYARAIERHLSRGFTYTERPPKEAQTLEGFLFDAKAGYCQQYSGAMALLLRMGGVPARVATGFTSGSQDRESKEYVVRDYDAHSWVEAWFPGWGWVVFDPTPSAAPPRAQADRDASAIAGIGDVADLGAGDRLDPRTSDVAADGSGPSWSLILGGLAVIGVASGLFVLFGRPRLRRRRRERTPLSELERALRRTNRAPPAGQTLRALESALGAPAAGYIQAVREERFGGRPSRPTSQQRRALRAALGRGSPLAKLRAWWALPPRFSVPRGGVH